MNGKDDDDEASHRDGVDLFLAHRNSSTISNSRNRGDIGVDNDNNNNNNNNKSNAISSSSSSLSCSSSLQYFVRDRFVPAEQAVLPIEDLAILRGYGVFESLRTYRDGTIPFMLLHHLQRLQNSANALHLVLPCHLEMIGQRVYETLQLNQHVLREQQQQQQQQRVLQQQQQQQQDIDTNAYSALEFNLRILVTGGVSPNGFLPVPGHATLAILPSILSVPTIEYYQRGVAVMSLPASRDVLHPTIKSLNYAAAVANWQQQQDDQQQEQQQQQQSSESNMDTTRPKMKIEEGIYVDANGYILEGTRCNVFVVFKEEVLADVATNQDHNDHDAPRAGDRQKSVVIVVATAPATTVLPGITRHIVLTVLQQEQQQQQQQQQQPMTEDHRDLNQDDDHDDNKSHDETLGYDWKIEERLVSMDELTMRNKNDHVEVFLTGTSKEIVSVVQIDHQMIGTTGRPGPMTRYIHRLFQRYVQQQIAVELEQQQQQQSPPPPPPPQDPLHKN